MNGKTRLQFFFTLNFTYLLYDPIDRVLNVWVSIERVIPRPHNPVGRGHLGLIKFGAKESITRTNEASWAILFVQRSEDGSRGDCRTSLIN